MWLRIIGAIAFTATFGVIGYFIIAISMILSTKNGYVYVGILVVATLIVVNVMILGVLKNLSRKLANLIPILIYAIPLVIYGGYETYMNSIEIENAEVDLTQYEPFEENTKVARLDGNSSFQLKEPLPALDGATALYPVYSAFTRALYPEGYYPHDNPLESKVIVSKTNDAYDKLASQDVDMIFAAGPSSAQKRKLGDERELTPIGKEGFVFFVHTSNPVDTLTIEELQGIYSGEITNWKKVGGKDQEIIAFQRPEGSGSQTGLQNMMGNVPIMEPPSDQRVTGMGGVIKKASNYRNHRNAIGFSYRYFATKMVKQHGIKLLKVNDVTPDVDSIQSESYPLTGEFYAITNGTENPQIAAFKEWILSEEGQTLIEKTGYVPIGR
ncbi:hypothetical protein GLW08_06660 [Pontibacillus yanchengensis]|uniref:Uncharacterized protein n=2 Tax=Pontibacillus yanchengensis TaxID=462910 RepID=A0ACC7VDG7_9BACI|nr:substrate-binding domain-containing protein [Pontibacillus yanchengensis]MYL32437.1 hypothetical protein [Pontibacillus yanchengensis]MYL53018.1 hypothetical protein [Pontibacillus yanchengensis]